MSARWAMETLMIRFTECSGHAFGVPVGAGTPFLSASAVFNAIAHLEQHYPGFRAWFFGKVVPGIGTGTRQVFVHSNESGLLGVAIAKRGEEEKLCTLWVHPSARASGIANSLGRQAFDWLGTDHPLFTVPEERLKEFRGLLNRWQFQQCSKQVGYYRAGKVEHVFNRNLRPEVLA